MVEYLEYVASAGADERVIKRGAEIDKNKGSAEDAATEDDRERSTRGCGDEEDRSNDREEQADAMSDSVGEEVAQMDVVVHSDDR